jgi:PAS domain S-box-containing protein
VRLLQGEAASTIKGSVQRPGKPIYDDRELRRWNISPKRLPAGSVVMYREPTLWARYRWRIAATASLVVLNTGLITILLANLIKRHRAERSLAETEARFRTVSDQAPIMIWMSATDKRCTFLNKSWLGFTGRPLDQELGNGWAEGVHANDLKKCLATYTEAFDARKPFVMEYRLRRHDGEYRWISDAGTPQYDNGGTFLGYIGSCLDVTEQKLAEQTARELSGRLLQAQEEERARLARELHDDITQRLARLAIDAGRAEASRDPAIRGAALKEVRDGLVQLSEDVHSLSYRLHPSLLDDLGLADALRAECERFSRHESIPVVIQLAPLSASLPRDTGLCIFRVTQEALRNVARHSRAKSAAVSLEPFEGGLRLTVSDTGVGFNPGQQQHRHSLGLASMGERIRLRDGKLNIESAAGCGTTIVAWLPLNGRAH